MCINTALDTKALEALEESSGLRPSYSAFFLWPCRSLKISAQIDFQKRNMLLTEGVAFLQRNFVAFQFIPYGLWLSGGPRRFNHFWFLQLAVLCPSKKVIAFSQQCEWSRMSEWLGFSSISMTVFRVTVKHVKHGADQESFLSGFKLISWASLTYLHQGFGRIWIIIRLLQSGERPFQLKWALGCPPHCLTVLVKSKSPCATGFHPIWLAPCRHPAR